MGHPAPEQTETDRIMVRAAESRAKFLRSSSDWGERVPDQFKTLDFGFVMGNIPQFKSARLIEEVEDARRSLAEPLKVAVGRIRSGSDAVIGEVRIRASDSGGRQVVLSAMDEFERKVGRHLDKVEGNGALPSGFDGMKLGQGVGLLREIGVLYFSVQEKLLEAEKEDEMSRRPTFGVSVPKVNGVAGDIPVCTVCQNLIAGLIPA